MNIRNYAEILPNPDCDPQDAIEALVEKVPWYLREWLFDISDFVQMFVNRVNSIMANLSWEESKIKKIEDTLIYIFRDLGINRYLNIIRDNEILSQRWIKILLDSEWVLTDYLWFSQWEIHKVDISNPELFIDFLDYLAYNNSDSIKEVMVYVQTCVRISQLDGWVDILMIHLKKVFARIPMDMIDSMIDQNRWYLGGKSWDFDECIRCIQDDEGLSYEEASLEFEEFQRDCAGFHFFLIRLHSEYIYPKMWDLPIQKVHEIYSTLNDLRDIVDPEYYIPTFFHNGNIPELLERQRMVEEGRDIQ